MKNANEPPYRWSDLVESVIIALLLAFFIRTFVLTAYKIPTSAMVPTLRPGDFVLALKTPFGFKLPLLGSKIAGRQPERGELVIFQYPNKPGVVYLKRVLALAGDHVEIKNRQVFVNEVPLAQEALSSNQFTNFPGADFLKFYQEDNGIYKYNIVFSESSEAQNLGPLIVPPGEVFVVGDNRDASDDSRYWGTVPMTSIEAKALLIWLSLDWGGGDKRTPALRSERLFKMLH